MHFSRQRPCLWWSDYGTKSLILPNTTVPPRTKGKLGMEHDNTSTCAARLPVTCSCLAYAYENVKLLAQLDEEALSPGLAGLGSTNGETLRV